MAFSTDTIQHISVVIITFNRKDDLEICLDSLEDQNFSSYQVIVVDNDSTDGTATMVREDYKWVEYISLEDNIGIDARNHGFDRADGDLVVTLDDDSELPNDNILERMAEPFERNSDLGAAGFRIIDEDGQEETWFDWSKAGNTREGYRSPTFPTCAAAIRPEAYERTEGFWPPYFVYMEDRDLATRIINTGAEIRYYPNVSVIHHRSIANREQGKEIYFKTRNLIWYFWRNFGILLATRKTLFHLLSKFRLVIRKGEGFGIVLKALVDGVKGLGRAFRTRDPAEPEYLDWILGRFPPGPTESEEISDE